jgi:hypothetical protein
MCSDYSDRRAGVVRRLNAAGVPVVGIPLLPLAEGYYFTTDNAGRAAGSYRGIHRLDPPARAGVGRRWSRY